MKEYFSIETLTEDSDFYNLFCADCPAMYIIPESMVEPEEICCPVSFEPWNKKCERYTCYKVIQDAIDTCNNEISNILDA